MLLIAHTLAEMAKQPAATRQRPGFQAPGGGGVQNSSSTCARESGLKK